MGRIVKGIGYVEEGDDESKLKHRELTDAILKLFYVVYNKLGGYGFLEKVYKNSLAYELRKHSFKVDSEKPIQVFYDGVLVGEYIADLVVNDLVILEIKAVETISDAHKAQLTNYLKATHIEVGLILNFGPKPQIARRVFDNSRKTLLKPANS